LSGNVCSVSYFGEAKIDSRGVELILTCLIMAKRIDSNLKLEFGTFDSKIDFNTQIYCSIHFYMNISKHKSLYI